MNSKERFIPHINQFDLIDAGKHLGIKNPLSAYVENQALARLLTMYAKIIALKRIKHQEQIDNKRRQAGDID